MIIINHDLSQCSDCYYFNRFDCNAKVYAADADIENSDCFNKEKQIYHTIDNDNNSEESENKENNSVINFTLSKFF